MAHDGHGAQGEDELMETKMSDSKMTGMLTCPDCKVIHPLGGCAEYLREKRLASAMTDTLRDRLGALVAKWRDEGDASPAGVSLLICAIELERLAAQPVTSYSAEYLKGYDDGCTDGSENARRDAASQPAPAVMGEGAMRRLISECKAVLAFEHELREISVLGNTNVNAFKLRVEEAEAELGRAVAAESREERDGH